MDVNTICENNTGLVFSIAQKFGSGNSTDFDDLVSAGMVGLFKGAQKMVSGEYDPEKSAESTYLGVWISGEIRREFKHLRNVVRIPEWAVDSGVTVECGTIADDFDVEDTSGESGISSDLAQLLDTIPAEDRELLIRNVVNGESVRSIGESLGVSRETIRKRIVSIRETLLSNA